jgi:DNA-binding response OmpR family regulator
MDDYVTKPLERERLDACIEGLLNGDDSTVGERGHNRNEEAGATRRTGV